MTNPGDTFYPKVELKDKDGDPLTPDSQLVTLYDPTGTAKDSDTAPSLIAGSTYQAELTVPSDGIRGTWEYHWIATKDGVSETEVFKVYVGIWDHVIAAIKLMIHTSFTDEQLETFAARADAWVTLKIGTIVIDDDLREELLATRSSFRIMLRDPTSWKLGEYSEDRTAAMKFLKDDLDDLIDTVTGVGGPIFIVAHEPIDE